ncbi:50S ribosomal protein L35 [bacterium]|jgi:large subunit ribosomal protein L35|nr:50S ribosomal protein L35 [bacterium]
MPKMKTHAASKKRFKKVGSSKIKRSSAYRRHLLTKKTAKRKRDLRKDVFIDSVDAPRMKVLLPY